MLCTQGQGAGAGVGDEEDPVGAHRDHHRGQGGDRGGHDLCSGILSVIHKFRVYSVQNSFKQSDDNGMDA